MKLDDVIFFFMRHGETAGNKKNIYRSWSNASDAQLDASGRKATEDGWRFLSTIGAPIEMIIADSLDRVQESMEPATQFFPHVRMEFVRALHPLNMGDWTLQSKDEHPVEPFLNDYNKRIPGGDTVGEFNERQAEIFKTIFEIARDLKGGKILVGGHGSNVAYLFNHVFNRGAKRIGYEGMVDPAGIIACTPTGMIPLTLSREKGKKETDQPELGLNITYPADHQVGMRVPKGGSNCAKCEYVNGQDCTQEQFVKWNGSEVIPAPTDSYCCDFFSVK